MMHLPRHELPRLLESTFAECGGPKGREMLVLLPLLALLMGSPFYKDVSENVPTYHQQT